MAYSTVVVMGVSGVGKTTVARALAERLGVPFAEADDFHPPANVAKMSAGTPLTDADREPWLRSLGAWLGEREKEDSGGVMTCSALKRAYRETLRAGAPGVFFLHLEGSKELIEERLGRRTGHFMPPALLASQFSDLEPLGAGENGAVLDVRPTPEELVDQAIEVLAVQ
ncbi:gluconokinase [Streptomyces sp. MP131-18]|uniref:gluconokinase n=1 Tax=Streptomyces sp. MP131-18 TaxID=1857892 RepID=UPI00097C2500|nr:gluconokinase [Streptomyces sp. MP131-18]ONK09989.1 Thermoresistant gluconokinase [Streptomyces sp. MP131-18]